MPMFSWYDSWAKERETGFDGGAGRKETGRKQQNRHIDPSFPDGSNASHASLSAQPKRSRALKADRHCADRSEVNLLCVRARGRLTHAVNSAFLLVCWEISVSLYFGNSDIEAKENLFTVDRMIHAEMSTKQEFRC